MPFANIYLFLIVSIKKSNPVFQSGVWVFLKKDNLLELKKIILNNLDSGPFHFPDDSITEFSDNFFISEIIREKAINRLGDELPYRLNVVIEKIDDFFCANSAKFCY